MHLCKKMEVRCFSFMESTVTVRVTGAKKVQHDPPFFCAYDKPSLFSACRKYAGRLLDLCGTPVAALIFCDGYVRKTR